jgi:hypothetical protein
MCCLFEITAHKVLFLYIHIGPNISIKTQNILTLLFRFVSHTVYYLNFFAFDPGDFDLYLGLMLSIDGA